MKEINDKIQESIERLYEEKKEINELNEKTEKLQEEMKQIDEKLETIEDRESGFYKDLNEEKISKDLEFREILNRRLGKEQILKSHFALKKMEIITEIQEKMKIIDENRNAQVAENLEDLKQERENIEKELKLNDVTKEEFLKLSDEEKQSVRKAKERYLINKNRLNEISPKIEILELLDGKESKDRYLELQELLNDVKEKFTIENLDNLYEEYSQDIEQEDSIINPEEIEEQEVESSEILTDKLNTNSFKLENSEFKKSEIRTSRINSQEVDNSEQENPQVENNVIESSILENEDKVEPEEELEDKPKNVIKEFFLKLFEKIKKLTNKINPKNWLKGNFKISLPESKKEKSKTEEEIRLEEEKRLEMEKYEDELRENEQIVEEYEKEMKEEQEKEEISSNREKFLEALQRNLPETATVDIGDYFEKVNEAKKRMNKDVQKSIENNIDKNEEKLI